MSYKKPAYLLLILVIALSLTCCVDQHKAPTNTSGDNLPKLIATSPAIAEICDKLDLDLVGVSTTSKSLPERYLNVTKVGSPMSPDMEILKSLSPDYVLSPNSLQNDLAVKYDSVGIKSIFVNLKSVDGMYNSISKLGENFNRQDKAKKLIDEYKNYITKYKKGSENKNHPKVLILMGLPGSYVVATENSYVGSLVKLAGGINVYQNQTEEFITANTEDMKSKNPDIILRTAHAMPEQVMKMFADEFKTNDIWKHFNAVKNDRVYDLDPDKFGMSAKFNYPDALNHLQKVLYTK